jgi:hypothetical protein
MILDFLAQFTGGTTGVGNSDNISDSPTTGTQVSSVTMDIGVGLETVTNPLGAAIPNNAAGAGARDLGIGDDPALKILVETLAYVSGGTSIQVNLQGAPDNGSGAPGAFTTYINGAVIPVASASIVGATLLDIDVPRVVFGAVMPRFLQLQYISVGTFAAGFKIRGNVVLDRFDQIRSSAGALSGYPPGITIAN